MRNKQLIITFISLLFIGAFATNAQSNRIDNESVVSLLAKKRTFNKAHGYGFRIQLYNGIEKTAKSLKGKFEVEYPGVYTKLEYNAPEWKIQVGNYKTRLEADKALNKIQSKFSGAIVIPL